MALELEQRKLKKEMYHVEYESKPKVEGIESPSVPICTPAEDIRMAHGVLSTSNARDFIAWTPPKPKEEKKTIADYMPNTHVNSFTLDTHINPDDVKKLLASLEPGKPIAVSNFSLHIRAGGPVEAKATTADGTVVTFSDCDFPSLEPDGCEIANTIWAIDSRDAIVMADGPVRRGGRSLGVYHHYGPIIKFPDIDTIMKDIKEMKKKYDKWITFEEKTGNWNRIVTKAMQGDKRYIKQMQKLSDRHGCMLGTAWGGSDTWGKNGEQCSGCETLGTELLRMFTEEGEFGSYHPLENSMQRYDEYKMMFEWHWNNAHR